MAKIAWLEEIKEKVGVNDAVCAEPGRVNILPPPAAKQVSTKPLPTFPSDTSGFPHCVARSALFAPIRRGPRRYRDNELIASRGDVEIRYTGKQLDMGDQDVFLQAIVVAQSRPAGEVCLFERAAFLRSIGRRKGKSDYIWLQNSLERLKTANTKLETKKELISTSLIATYGIEKESGSFYVRLTPEAIKLFQAYGHIDMKKRALIKHDFTKWLQSYVSSHERGKHAIGVDRLHQWSGSETLLKKWKLEKLKPALIELEKLGIIRAAKIVDETAEWERI